MFIFWFLWFLWVFLFYFIFLFILFYFILLLFSLTWLHAHGCFAIQQNCTVAQRLNLPIQQKTLTFVRDCNSFSPKLRELMLFPALFVLSPSKESTKDVSHAQIMQDRGQVRGRYFRANGKQELACCKETEDRKHVYLVSGCACHLTAVRSHVTMQYVTLIMEISHSGGHLDADIQLRHTIQGSILGLQPPSKQETEICLTELFLQENV